LDLELLMQLLVIIGIDIVLGGDNAIVIALASRNLPETQRNKAILFGTGLAIVIRILLTIVAVYLLKIPFLQLVGGLFLIYIAYNLIVEPDEDTSSIRGGTTLGAAIRTIVFADIVMGFDNVIAIAGASHGNIILVVFGLLVSVPIIIWGSKLILMLLEKYPILIYIGSAILAYTAGTMIVHEHRFHHFMESNPVLPFAIPALSIVVVLTAGWVANKLKRK
jgi:YjbE family integral membrane protein